MDNLPEIRDIHIPDGVSIFPLAYGWWVILAALAAAAIAARFILWAYQTSKKNYALKQLKQIDIAAPVKAAMEMSELLRRICNVKYKNASALYGREWIVFLEKHSAANLSAKAEELLLQAPFMQPNNKSYSIEDAQELQDFCESFIGANL